MNSHVRSLGTKGIESGIMCFTGKKLTKRTDRSYSNVVRNQNPSASNVTNRAQGPARTEATAPTQTHATGPFGERISPNEWQEIVRLRRLVAIGRRQENSTNQGVIPDPATPSTSRGNPPPPPNGPRREAPRPQRETFPRGRRRGRGRGRVQLDTLIRNLSPYRDQLEDTSNRNNNNPRTPEE